MSTPHIPLPWPTKRASDTTPSPQDVIDISNRVHDELLKLCPSHSGGYSGLENQYFVTMAAVRDLNRAAVRAKKAAILATKTESELLVALKTIAGEASQPCPVFDRLESAQNYARAVIARVGGAS